VQQGNGILLVPLRVGGEKFRDQTYPLFARHLKGKLLAQRIRNTWAGSRVGDRQSNFSGQRLFYFLRRWMMLPGQNIYASGRYIY
jgi:hypothetical protein